MTTRALSPKSCACSPPAAGSPSIDFAQMDRPVGPPNDHVLSLDEARAVVAGMGLRELSVHQPGEIGRYHFAILCERPATGSAGKADA